MKFFMENDEIFLFLLSLNYILSKLRANFEKYIILGCNKFFKLILARD